MSVTLDIPAQEAHVLRVFAVTDPALSDAAAITALGAESLEPEQVEVFDLGDLGDMPLSAYLAEGQGISAGALAPMRAQLDGLTGRVLLLPSRAFGGRAQRLSVGAGLRLVGRFEEESAPVQFDPLPAGGAEGVVAPKGAVPKGRGARLAALVFFLGLAVLAALVLWLARGA
ncbi:MAG: hypothetical protein CMN17_06670 [Roseovarius sp.]|nr:hypothetical protein [Roseovarius sp.]